MDAPELKLTFIPAPDDLPLKTPEYQARLGQFVQSLNSQGVEVCAVEIHEFSDLGFAGVTGDFIIKLAEKVVAPVIAGIAGWLQVVPAEKFTSRLATSKWAHRP